MATKVFLDQTGLTIPILFVFFTTMSLLEGKEDLLADFLEKFPVTFAVRGTLLICVSGMVGQNEDDPLGFKPRITMYPSHPPTCTICIFILLVCYAFFYN